MKGRFRQQGTWNPSDYPLISGRLPARWNYWRVGWWGSRGKTGQITAGGQREDRKTDWWGGCVDKEDGLRKWKQMEWYERGQIDWALKLRQTDWKNDRGRQTLNRTQSEGGMDRLMERRKDNLRLRVKRNSWAWSAVLEMHAVLKGFGLVLCVWWATVRCNHHRHRGDKIPTVIRWGQIVLPIYNVLETAVLH